MSRRHVDTAMLLIDSGADVGAKALMLACFGGHVDTARLLIGLDIFSSFAIVTVLIIVLAILYRAIVK